MAAVDAYEQAPTIQGRTRPFAYNIGQAIGVLPVRDVEEQQGSLLIGLLRRRAAVHRSGLQPPPVLREAFRRNRSGIPALTSWHQSDADSEHLIRRYVDGVISVRV